MNQASGSRRARHFGVPRRALERTAGNTLLLEHSDAVETRLDDDVSNIAEDCQRVKRCSASTSEIVKISVSYFSAALRADVEQTRKKQDKSLSDFKERTVTASMALEGSIQHTSQGRTPERVTEQDVVIPIRQNGGSQEREQQHTVGQHGRHTGASDYSARALQLRAAYSVSAVTAKIWKKLIWRTLHHQLL